MGGVRTQEGNLTDKSRFATAKQPAGAFIIRIGC